MAIHLNPIMQAELELRALLLAVPGVDLAKMEAINGVVKRAVAQERLLMGQHPDCGADNPEGVAALCKCYCHKGHYRHAWVPVIKTPMLNPDGSYHLMDRCKFCPDIRFHVIKAGFVQEKHTLVSKEYLIRGTQQVLTKEEWLESSPKATEGKLLRTGEL